MGVIVTTNKSGSTTVQEEEVGEVIQFNRVH